MSVIHRSAVIIRPLPPYLAWAKQDDTTNIAERVFEDLRTAPHVYLLPEYEDAESEREVLEDFWPELFAAMLNCWLTDEQQWPKNRTHQMFSGSTSRCVRWSRICIWMKSWSNSTRAGHAAIPDSRRPYIWGSSAESVGEMQPVDLTGWCPALGKPRVFHSPTGPTNADPF